MRAPGYGEGKLKHTPEDWVLLGPQSRLSISGQLSPLRLFQQVYVLPVVKKIEELLVERLGSLMTNRSS